MQTGRTTQHEFAYFLPVTTTLKTAVLSSQTQGEGILDLSLSSSELSF
jgi:hypothetical protein